MSAREEDVPPDVEVIEARISHLGSAPEIDGAMLHRHKAAALVVARKKIAEGAVGIVEHPLEELSQKESIQQDLSLSRWTP